MKKIAMIFYVYAWSLQALSISTAQSIIFLYEYFSQDIKDKEKNGQDENSACCCMSKRSGPDADIACSCFGEASGTDAEASFGCCLQSQGYDAHAKLGCCACAEGNNTRAVTSCCVSASGDGSEAEGCCSCADGADAYTSGCCSRAKGEHAYAYGCFNYINGAHSSGSGCCNCVKAHDAQLGCSVCSLATGEVKDLEYHYRYCPYCKIVSQDKSKPCCMTSEKERRMIYHLMRQKSNADPSDQGMKD